MRTTLDIDEDVMAATKELARRQKVSMGKVVSKLLREALTGPGRTSPVDPSTGRTVGAFRPFPPRGAIVTNEQIDTLREEEGL